MATKPKNSWLELAGDVRSAIYPYLVNECSFDGDLACACAVASYALWRVYKRRKYVTTFAMGTFEDMCHCFLVRADHVIDITATQFRYPGRILEPVHCVPLSEPYMVKLVDDDALGHVNDWEDQAPNQYWGDLKKLLQDSQLW